MAAAAHAGSAYLNDVFSMIGTLFLWLYVSGIWAWQGYRGR